MAKGDHLIAVMRYYTHHGIDIGDGTVVHWCSDLPSTNHGSLSDLLARKVSAAIRRTSLEAFHEGRPYYVSNHPNQFDADRIVERALSRVGETGYHLIWNNCEHFATWCTTGQHYSSQVARLMGPLRGRITRALSALGDRLVERVVSLAGLTFPTQLPDFSLLRDLPSVEDLLGSYPAADALSDG